MRLSNEWSSNNSTAAFFDNLVGTSCIVGGGSRRGEFRGTGMSHGGGGCRHSDDTSLRRVDQNRSSSIARTRGGWMRDTGWKNVRDLLPQVWWRGSGQGGQASKGVWGMSGHQKAKGRGRLRKVRASCQTSADPGIPERTEGTETSHYLQERKEKSTPSVAASERGRA